MSQQTNPPTRTILQSLVLALVLALSSADCFDTFGVMDQPDSIDELIAQGERWPPLGAAEPEDASSCDYDDDQDYWQSFTSYDGEKLRLLEEEQEQLNSSLMALTSHFAQVQFRLKQIVDAEPDKKETLLRELEEFAFRGIPDLHVKAIVEATCPEEDHATKMESHRVKQQELICQLKEQLQDLEQYAYETGEAGLPQTMVVERQKIIIDQMKSKLQLNVDDLDKYTVEELRHQVDQAISQLVNPLKMKEQLVAQLKTQITDLERFIQFLQDPAGNKCACSPIAKTKAQSTARAHPKQDMASRSRPLHMGGGSEEKVNQIMQRISNLLQIYVVSQFGCGVQQKFTRDILTRDTSSSKQLRESFERLNTAVVQVVELAASPEKNSAKNSSWEMDARVDLLKTVRKSLCPALRDLLSHGLIQPSTSKSIVPFLSCASVGRPGPSNSAASHPWQLFLAFYRDKDGEAVMTTPQRSLAQSFSLEIQGGTSKQSLLAAIGNIIEMHRPYKRGPEAHFKAFLSCALNAKKIVPWLRIVLRCPSLLDEYYEPWAFVLQPGFDDVWKILDPLQNQSFMLPEDLSIRSLRNIFDAF